MNIAVRLERRAERSARRAVPAGVLMQPVTAGPHAAARPQLAASELAFRLFACFRAHPHINNVLTHVSRADWAGVERALNAILDPAATSEALSPLAVNLVDLLCAERGVTGKIMKPYFHEVLNRLIEPDLAGRLIDHVEVLSCELEWRAQHPAPPAPAAEQPAQGEDHA